MKFLRKKKIFKAKKKNPEEAKIKTNLFFYYFKNSKKNITCLFFVKSPQNLMECVFNNFVPSSTETTVIVNPTGRTFVTGLSFSYDNSYPPQLKSYIDEKSYTNTINDINNIIANYWPCFCARLIGYWCCPCSLGLSFCLPELCIGDAEEALQRMFDHINQTTFHTTGLKIRLVKKCSTSWLEIKIIKGIKVVSYGILHNEKEVTDIESS